MEGYLELRQDSCFSFYSPRRWSKCKRNAIEFPPIGTEEDERPSLKLSTMESVQSIGDTEFRIEWKDGSSTYFRAPSEAEKGAWLECIEIFVEHHLSQSTTVFRSDTPSLSLSTNTNPSINSNHVGSNSNTPLTTYDRKFDISHHLLIPLSYCKGILCCIEHLQKTGAFDVEGIFRLPGRPHECRDLLNNYLVNGKFEIDKEITVHAVATVLKTLLSSLPETILTNILYQDFLTATEKKDIEELGKLISSLPPQNKLLLMELLGLSKAICDSESSRMTSVTLSLVLGPSLLLNDDPELLMQLRNTMSPFFTLVSEHYETLLGSTVQKELEAERKLVLASTRKRRMQNSSEKGTTSLLLDEEQKGPYVPLSPSQSSNSSPSSSPSSTKCCCCFGRNRAPKNSRASPSKTVD